jgi:AcrR family transcriptional regulator
MPKSRTVHKKLSARKKPSQPRSQKMVKGILDATRRLVTKPNGIKLSKISTNHIADEAGISVGSLYQYFPNKDAIVFELYKQMLDEVSSVLDVFKTEVYLSLPRDKFFDKFNRAMKGAEADAKFVIEMLHAMQNSPMLVEADRHHSELIAKEMANFMKHFGSKWSMKKLQRLALHVYYINYGTWVYREHVNPPRQEVLDWEVSILNFMVAKCFD